MIYKIAIDVLFNIYNILFNRCNDNLHLMQQDDNHLYICNQIISNSHELSNELDMIYDNPMVSNMDDKYCRIDIKSVNFDNCFISPLTYSYIPDMILIEEKSFGIPWDRNDFLESIKNNMAYGIFLKTNIDKNDPNKIINILAGYILYFCAKDEVLVVNIAIHPIFRRHGLGTKLMESKIISRFMRSDPWGQKLKLTTVVFNSDNLLAALFFKSIGYKWVETREHDYHDIFESCEDYILKMSYKDYLWKHNKAENKYV